MERKNVFLILLVFAMTFACAPILAQTASQGDTPLQKPNVRPAPPRPWSADAAAAQRTASGPYRVTYTLTEMDGTKRVGSQRYAIVLDAGLDVPPAQLRLGSKIPLETGEFHAGSGAQTQISYIDVGLNIEASLLSFANGLELRSHVIQSSVDTDTRQSLAKDPVVRQTDFKSAVLLNENKPMTIGNVDMPGTTHVLQIQVELNKLP